MDWIFGTSGASNTALGTPTITVSVNIRPRMAAGARPVDMMHQLSLAWSDGLRYEDINEDQGIYDKESVIGIGVAREASSHMRAGDAQVMSKLYGTAQASYTKALELWIQIKNNGESLGIAFVQRANAYRKMKDYDKALEDALSAIRCYPVLTEASLQLTHVYEAMGKYEDAFEICSTSAALFTHKADYLTLAAKLALKVPGGLQALALRLHSDEDWQQTLNALTKEGSWSTVRTLLMGTDDLTPLVSSFDASEVELASLVDFVSRDNLWKNWGQKLTQQLLRNGADHQTLCVKSKYPFHVALRIGLQTETFELLKWLLDKKANNTCHVNTILDDGGDSLLHTACRSTSTSKCTAIQLLLNCAIDTGIRNKERKRALDYLAERDPGYDVIKKYETKMSDKVCCITDRRVSSAQMDKVERIQPLVAALTGTRTQPPVMTPFPRNMLCFEHIKSWSKPEVIKWLEKNDLHHYKTKFEDVDGPLLYEMKMMQNVAPEMFYKVLEESLQLSLDDLLKVSFSLRQIREDNPN